MKRTIQIVTVFSFCIFLVAVNAQMFFKLVSEPTLLEKRPQASRPSLASASDLLSDKFTIAFDTYVNDNFGFRKLFIRLNNFIDAKLFRTPSNRRVIFGNDEFLFGLPDWESFTHHQKVQTDQEVFETALKLKALQDRLKARGIEFLFLMAPNKGTVYPEQFRQKGYRLNAISDRQRWNSALDKAGVNNIDVLAEILKEKENRLVYYKGDHHWNKYAGLIATRRIVDMIAAKLGASPPAFQVTGAMPDDTEKTGGGSLDELLGVKAWRFNEQPKFTVSGRLLPPGVVFGDSFVHWLSLNHASEELISVADLNAAKKLSKAVARPDIKFLVIHLSEAHPDELASKTIWNVDGRGTHP